VKTLILFFLILPTSFAQNIDYARKVVNTLASPECWGRGYTRDGMKKAADYLVTELESAKMLPLDPNGFRLSFTMPINTFPGSMQVSINGKVLVPGRDFLVTAKSRGLKASGNLVQTDASHFADASHSLTVSIEDKLTWSARGTVDTGTTIQLNKASLTEIPSTFEISIENEFVPDFAAANIATLVKGTVHPDEFILMSAHYDHLGGMGTTTYFPGANDNASGTAALLDLARYYSIHPQPYSMVFVFFAAEEAGLVGSKYFVEHPPIDLKKIEFVMNLDLLGNGDQGATLVNATEFKSEFEALKKINTDGKFLPVLYPRGKAPNSDHYWFSEHGVPAFFLYTMGGPPYYHDINDRSEVLPFSRYESVFKLLVGFNTALQDQSTN
jgi:aminopeptidase YwaD